MAKQNKVIHLIQFTWSYRCHSVCDRYIKIEPIEAIIKVGSRRDSSKGTFNPTKVTCKRCLKHPDYKEAMDRVKYPLLFWKEIT